MIKVINFKSKGLNIGFKIEGHALSKSEMDSTVGDAYDMICNSISVLSQSILIGIVEVLNISAKYKIDNGFLSMDLSNLNKEDIKRGQVLLLTFEKSLESIISSLDDSLGIKKRNKYIQVIYKEV